MLYFVKELKKYFYFWGFFPYVFVSFEITERKTKNKIDNPLSKLVMYGTEYLRTCLIENEKTNNTFVLSLSVP